MMQRLKLPRKQERGFVMVSIALASVAMVLFVGFVTDLGAWYLTASKLQRAADAAALTGATASSDPVTAAADAREALRKNGYIDGVNGISITIETTDAGVKTMVKDSNVETYFTRTLFPSLEISRSSSSSRSALEPQMGSPFNVLGTGDLEIPTGSGSLPKQNFWLAMNLACSPKEDGDYFAAMTEGSKGPFTADLDANNNYLAPNGRHHCTGSNPDYNPAGYSYFIDVPKPPSGSGTVDIKIFDPAYKMVDLSTAPDAAPDVPISLGDDDGWINGITGFDLFDMGDDPDDETGGVSLLPHPYIVSEQDDRVAPNSWWTLATIPNSRIVNGGHFRVQIFNQPDDNNARRGINAFSIGAFPSWKPAMSGCDTRTDDDCPTVYGRKSMSVLNMLPTGGPADQTSEFFFARMDPAFAGRNFNVMLWDPGEGVKQIELLAPDGSPLEFDWGTTPGDSAAYSGIDATSIRTDEFGPPPNGIQLSNPYKFNGRLITMKVTLPYNYGAIATAADSDWLRLRYTVAGAAHDRTTWGISLEGGQSGAPRLVRPG